MTTPATNQQDLTPPLPSSPAKKKTPEQIERIAERRRERKDAARTPRQQAAERIAQDLQKLIWDLDRIPAGAEFDEYRDELNRTVARIRKIGARTQDRAAAAVMEALADPMNYRGARLVDLSSDTDMPTHVVQKVLDGMLAVGTVGRRQESAPDITRGPRPWVYFLSDKKPRTDQVLP